MGLPTPVIQPRTAAPQVRYNPTHIPSRHTGSTTFGSTTVIEETDSGIDLFGAIIVAEAIESIVLDDDIGTSFDTDY